MFFKGNLLLVTAIASVSFFGAAPADAQTPACYTLASLQGNYAVIANYGSNVAVALARRYFDGNGNLTGVYLLNGPTAGSTTGARTISTGTNVGTYTVNCDGTGTFTRVLTSSTGVVTTQTDNFVITGAVLQGGGVDAFYLATSLMDAQTTPSALVAGGIFVTRTYTRVPDTAQP
jgi:hypothetical protein